MSPENRGAFPDRVYLAHGELAGSGDEPGGGPDRGPSAPEPSPLPDRGSFRPAVDLTSLVGGLVLAAVGTLLMLETEDVIDLSLGYLWPALLAAAGATLLASGIRKGRR